MSDPITSVDELERTLRDKLKRIIVCTAKLHNDLTDSESLVELSTTIDTLLIGMGAHMVFMTARKPVPVVPGPIEAS